MVLTNQQIYLVCKCQNHEEDVFKLCVLLKKPKLYLSENYFHLKQRQRLIFNLKSCPNFVSSSFVWFYLINEARFSNIGKSTNYDCSGVRIDGRQTAQMLPNLLQISQTLGLSFHNCCHSTQSGPFQLFTPEIEINTG